MDLKVSRWLCQPYNKNILLQLFYIRKSGYQNYSRYKLVYYYQNTQSNILIDNLDYICNYKSISYVKKITRNR